MNYDLVLKELQQASTFDLFRLQAAIQRMLDDPARIVAVKAKLRPGMTTHFFDEQQNRLVPVQILEIRRTRASVQELETGKRWSIPFCTINIGNQAADIAPQRKQGLDSLSLRVGDRVGFRKASGEEIFGLVRKLNPKRAKIETENGIWNVPYSMLFRVIDGEPGDGELLPAAE